MAFGKACQKAGVQPIIGAMLGVKRPDQPDGVDDFRLARALCAERGRYDHLCELVSMAHLDRPLDQPPHVDFAQLAGRTDGLIALTAGRRRRAGAIVRRGSARPRACLCRPVADLFGDRLYVEFRVAATRSRTRAEPDLMELAYARGLPLVATNPSCFAEADFHEAHDAMLCIAAFDLYRQRRPSQAVRPTRG